MQLQPETLHVHACGGGGGATPELPPAGRARKPAPAAMLPQVGSTWAQYPEASRRHRQRFMPLYRHVTPGGQANAMSAGCALLRDGDVAGHRGSVVAPPLPPAPDSLPRPATFSIPPLGLPLRPALGTPPPPAPPGEEPAEPAFGGEPATLPPAPDWGRTPPAPANQTPPELVPAVGCEPAALPAAPDCPALPAPPAFSSSSFVAPPQARKSTRDGKVSSRARVMLPRVQVTCPAIPRGATAMARVISSTSAAATL